MNHSEKEISHISFNPTSASKNPPSIFCLTAHFFSYYIIQFKNPSQTFFSSSSNFFFFLFLKFIENLTADSYLIENFFLVVKIQRTAMKTFILGKINFNNFFFLLLHLLSFLIFSLFIVCGYALVRLYIFISNIDYSSNELNSTVNDGTANVRWWWRWWWDFLFSFFYSFYSCSCFVTFNRL